MSMLNICKLLIKLSSFSVKNQSLVRLKVFHDYSKRITDDIKMYFFFRHGH